jgi:hypothetical protein
MTFQRIAPVFAALSVVTAVLFGAAAPARAQTVFTGQGPNLLRRSYTLSAGQTIQFQTNDCEGSEDTAMFLLEGSVNTAGARKTVAWNDDQGQAFGAPWCSYIFFTNNTGSTKTYELVLTIYPGTPSAAVSYWVWQSSTGWVSESVTVNGLTAKFWQSGSVTHETAGLRPGGPGGGTVDTVLYLMNTTIGSNSNFDDDSSLGALSKQTVDMPCSSTDYNCWVVAGNFIFGSTAVNFQAWSSSGADSDGDGIVDGIETARSTLTNNADSDGDGLTDREELLGVPAASLSGVDGSLVMPWIDTGADPLTQDLFVEVDFMTPGGSPPAHNHDPRAVGNWTTFVNDLTATFQTDSAFTGRTIVPHILVSDQLTETTYLSFGACGAADTTAFYTVKGNASFFNPLRASVFHYLIMGHSHKFTNCSIDGWSGHGEIWGNDVMITPAGALTGNTGTVNEQHGTFVHELGHNLALAHWNNGNNPVVTGPNSCVHSSVLNYRYQTVGWGNGTIPAARRWGYSNGQCPAAGNGCGNTCNASRCVPNSETSPKTGCSPNNGSCDCDRGEWGIVNLDIPANAQMSFNPCQVAQCAGGSNDSVVREYFLGDTSRFHDGHRHLARARKRHMESAGMVEGRDFVVHPGSGRMYSVE